MTRAARLPPRAGRARDHHRRAAAGAVRRAGGRRATGSPASARSRRATAAGSTAASSSCPPRSAATSTGDDTVWEHEPLRRLAARRASSRLRASRLLAADGHPARQASLRSSGTRETRRGRCGSRPRVLARPARAAHRPHRLQGQLARALAREPRRRGGRASPGVPHRRRRSSSSRASAEGVDVDRGRHPRLRTRCGAPSPSRGPRS